jgi:hypothetical protein
MTDHTEEPKEEPSGAVLEFGGLRFGVSFRQVGATLRVDGQVNGCWTEMLRFDDFIDEPHFHAPASGRSIPFDRASLGEPLAWYVEQIRDHLSEWLETAGFGDVIATVDIAEVSRNSHRLTEAMVACVPADHTRVPGIGIQPIDTVTPGSA